MYDALRAAVTEIPATVRCWLRSPAWWAWLAVAVIAALLLDGVTP
jgi:hypothetical protein